MERIQSRRIILSTVFAFEPFGLRKIGRLSLTALLSLSFLGSLLSPANAAEEVAAATPAPVVTPAKPFVARDATRYGENHDLSKYGLKHIEVVYEGSLWPAGASRVQPDLRHISKVYIPKIRRKKLDVLIIDIEQWLFKPGLTAAQVSENIVKYKKVIDVFRRDLPGVKLGLYYVMPERNWLAPCGDPKKRASRSASWQQRTLQLQPLADAVDIMFPSLYTFYETKPAAVACWPNYAKANIEMAKQFGKPVWAFLWMKNRTGDTFLPASLWKTQLETVYQYADGVVLWSKASSRDRWNWTAPWWVETAKFLKAKGLAK
jgi:hypothetical protein